LDLSGLRKSRGLTQKQLAKKLGVATISIHCIENAKYDLTGKVRRAYSKFFKISEEEILKCWLETEQIYKGQLANG
jgi:DNA-binding XRE family transcriptional regulator